MNELYNLSKIKKSLELIIKSDDKLPVDFMAMMEREILIFLKEMEEEASQTPAGTRWLKGQLEINKNANIFYLKLVKNNDRDYFRKKGTSEIKLLLEKLLDEFELIINSGKKRYITG